MVKTPKVKFKSMTAWKKQLARGFDLLKRNADYIDKYTIPGHFPVGFTGARSGPFVQTISSKIPMYYDATNYWMTLPLDIDKQFGKNKSFLADIGYAAMSANTLSEFGSVSLAVFTEKIKKIWPKVHRVLPYNAGTQATDAALKWATSLVMMKNKLKPKDMKFVAVDSAFHGRCGYGIEGTRTSPRTADYQTEITLRIPDPVVIFNEIGEILKKETEESTKNALSILEKHFKKPTTSALILEYPIIAEGGAKTVDPKFLTGARKLADKYKKFLIIDCVQMFGKSGNWLTKEAMDTADVICIGKYSRVCAALLTDPTIKKYPDYAGTPGKFGATWQGHESAMLSTIAIMNTVEKKKLFANAIKMADKFYQSLVKAAKENKGIVRPRMVGSYVGFDIKAGSKSRDKLIEVLQDNGVLILPAGDKSIRFSPRLDIKSWEVDYLLKHIYQALEKVSK